MTWVVHIGSPKSKSKMLLQSHGWGMLVTNGNNLATNGQRAISAPEPPSEKLVGSVFHLQNATFVCGFDSIGVTNLLWRPLLHTCGGCSDPTAWAQTNKVWNQLHILGARWLPQTPGSPDTGSRVQRHNGCALPLPQKIVHNLRISIALNLRHHRALPRRHLRETLVCLLRLNPPEEKEHVVSLRIKSWAVVSQRIPVQSIEHFNHVETRANK